LQSRHTLLRKKKPLSSNSLEQQILTLERQRRELLEVNKQWDHQFRSMKQLYEKQLTEMKAKLDMSERRVSELEQERHRQHPEEERWRALGRERLLQEKKDTEVLSEALHEMKEENRLLKQKNASMTRKKEYYESEISRLNKALLDALKKQHPPVVGTPPGKGDRSSIEEMRTQLGVLKQQVQIYEEDFRKERSDRERLNEEKEALQKTNERLQSQLSRLSSQYSLRGPVTQLHSSSLRVSVMGVVGWCFTIQILGCIQCLAGHRSSSSSARQTISGMFLTSFRQMCSTRQMVRQQ
ncbi:TNFAIP3-interacting protein 3, partial [Corvus brachyrhynchos]